MASKKDDNTLLWLGVLCVGGIIVYKEFIEQKPVVKAPTTTMAVTVPPQVQSNPVQSIVSTLTNLITGSSNKRTPTEDLREMQTMVIQDDNPSYGLTNYRSDLSGYDQELELNS